MKVKHFKSEYESKIKILTDALENEKKLHMQEVYTLQ